MTKTFQDFLEYTIQYNYMGENFMLSRQMS